MPTLQELFGDAAEPAGQELAAALVASDERLLRGLIAMRQAKHLTQAEVAAACGVSQPTIAAFERYDSDPKLSTIRRYAHAIGATIEHGLLDHDAHEPDQYQWTFGTDHVYFKVPAPTGPGRIDAHYVQNAFARAS